MSQLWAIFMMVFIAELGDKTQLATLLFATQKGLEPWAIFLAATCALVLSTALAVFLGTVGQAWLAKVPLKLIAGLGFVAIGLWTLYSHYTASA